MFVAYKNIVCILKWPSLKAKIRKTKKSKFVKIDSCKDYAVAFLRRKKRGKNVNLNEKKIPIGNRELMFLFFVAG
jgi:hypothetical protein